MMYLKLAWRNIWRNKRRTLITVASIAFAVFFAVAMRAMQIGMYDLMIDNVVGSYAGYVQVHAKGYWEDQQINNALDYEEELRQKIESEELVELAAPRLEGFALAASKEQTKGVMLVGVDPQAEKQFMQLDELMQSGELFQAADQAVVIGSELADYFKLQVGDTLVFLGQGYHGVNAAGKYRISGISRFKSPELNNRLVLMPLKTSQDFFGAYGKVTSLALKINKPGKLEQARQMVEMQADATQHEVMDWQQMMPELVQSIQADSAGGLIMLMILYMIIFFGMFGTVLMMATERSYEFGVLVAVGMRKWKVSWVLLMETVMLSLIGVLVGWLFSAPMMWYFNHYPIPLTGKAADSMEEYGFEALIQFSTDPSIALTHGLIILCLAILICIYPALKVAKLKPVKAMRA
jgi:putative ABC transport system permease protein